MKERFEKRLLTGNLNIKCKNDDGSFRVWKADKADVVKSIIRIVDTYEQKGYKLTLRQLHYQLVSHDLSYVNHQTAYKKLGTILDDCRYAGVIDWDNIVDRGRQLKYPYFEYNVKSALERTADSYRLERQQGQKNHIEVWTEKDALTEIFERVTYPYGVGLCVNKGYTSSSAIYKAYERFSSELIESKKVTVLYFGDHDPSGIDMIRDIYERLVFMFENGNKQDYIDTNDFKVIAIGLTQQQIKKYKLPPNPAKLTDTRAGAYIAKYGLMSWEVDALSPEVLAEIVDTNIKNLMHMDTYYGVLEQERADVKTIKNFISKK